MDQKDLIEAARGAIQKFGPESEEYPCIGLFASHHQNELSAEYWKDRLGTTAPSRDDVLRILESVDSSIDDEEEEELDEGVSIDFTLPGNVTQYVLCVRFDLAGRVILLSIVPVLRITRKHLHLVTTKKYSA